MINPSLSFVKWATGPSSAALQTNVEGEKMNRLNDSEALDTFQQTVARIVRRLLEEGEEQQQQQQKEGKPCHSNA